jgi:isocitrate dehydrogenase
MVATGLGLKAATVTPPEIGGVGSPNRLLREGIDGSVIVRTGRRIPGVAPVAGTTHPIVVIRMAVGDAYGAEEGRDVSGGDEVAWRTEKINRSTCRFVAEYPSRPRPN